MMSEWISVKDTLPELEQEVLVYANREYLKRKIHTHFYWCLADFEDLKITHWMPLPTPPKEQPFTKEQSVVITGFTRVMACKCFSDFHADVEKRLGRPVFTHEFGDEKFADELKDLYAGDFLSMILGE